MAGYTVLKLKYVLIDMLFTDLGGIVLMATVAGVSCIAGGVTAFARLIHLRTMIKWEGVFGQLSGGPGSFRVATCAIEAEESCMNKRFPGCARVR